MFENTGDTIANTRVKKTIRVCIGIIVCAVGAELFYQAFCSDVAFLAPMRECRKNIVNYQNGKDASCPLSGETIGYEIFSESNLGDTGKRFVLAADKSLFHRQRTSLIPAPLRFAVILLDDGRTARWVGREADYQIALEHARKSVEGRVAESFFVRSSEYEQVMRYLSHEVLRGSD